MEETPTFQLKNYYITEAKFDFPKIEKTAIDVDIRPSGIFNKKTSIFELNLEIRILNKSDGDKEMIYINCLGIFHLKNIEKDVPEFFYINSISILFPYLRAFVSTLTAQANIPPLILSTYNLTSLGEVLKERTTKK